MSRRHVDGAGLGTKPLLTVTEAATLLGVDRSTLYRALQQEDCAVRTVRIGKQIRIPRGAVEHIIAGGGEDELAQDREVALPRRCPLCGSVVESPPSRRRPMCSAASRSASGTTSV